MYFRLATIGGITYLTLVKSMRIDGKPRQQQIANLGKIDELKSNGSLEKLCYSLTDKSDKAILLSELNSSQVEPAVVEIIGPPIVFQKIWEDCKLPSIINTLLHDFHYKFNMERVIFANVLQRLMDPGSDKALSTFLQAYDFWYKFEYKDQYSYRAMNWLGKPLEPHGGNDLDNALAFGPTTSSNVLEQSGGLAACTNDSAAKVGKGPKLASMVRTNMSLIEEAMHPKLTAILSHLLIYYYDTTSFYFHGKGGQYLGQRGYSKDHRGDLKQVVMGAVLDPKGIPVCTEIWPGNTSDVTTLLPIAERLRSRFGLENICMVADRGMISNNTIKCILDMGWSYILGVKMRQCKDSPEIFSDTASYIEISGERERSSDPAPLKVKSITINGTRYIVCLNTEEARKDAHDRENILESLTKQLNKGDKNLVTNAGFKKFLSSSKGSFSIDQNKVEEDSKFDGIFILTTNLNLEPEKIALKYKQLLSVESLFKGFKSIIGTRPIFHQTDNNIRGHIWISFLALVLKHRLLAAINSVISESDNIPEWDVIKSSLNNLSYTSISTKNKKLKLRSLIKPEVALIFKALRLKIPNTIIEC